LLQTIASLLWQGGSPAVVSPSSSAGCAYECTNVSIESKFGKQQFQLEQKAFKLSLAVHAAVLTVVTFFW